LTHRWSMQRYWQLCLVIAFVTFLLYRYIDEQNNVLSLQRTLPVLAQEVRELQEENLRLACDVAAAQSPQRLWQLVRRPEYGHLHFIPRSELHYISDVVSETTSSSPEPI
jgi:hypothetical protein